MGTGCLTVDTSALFCAPRHSCLPSFLSLLDLFISFLVSFLAYILPFFLLPPRADSWRHTHRAILAATMAGARAGRWCSHLSTWPALLEETAYSWVRETTNWYAPTYKPVLLSFFPVPFIPFFISSFLHVTCLPFLPTSLPAYLPSFPLSFLPSYLPTYLPRFGRALHVFLLGMLLVMDLVLPLTWSQTWSFQVLTVLAFLAELVLTVLAFLAELALTVLAFLTAHAFLLY